MYSYTKQCKAVGCTNTFGTNLSFQKYCSSKCAEREKAYRLREKRKAKGMCAQCGKENDRYPLKTYCTECADKFKAYYEPVGKDEPHEQIK